jgi:hypothetical protein
MLWVPTLSVEVESVATPSVLTAAVPIVVVPSRKVTVPVGLDPVTVAVRASD